HVDGPEERRQHHPRRPRRRPLLGQRAVRAVLRVRDVCALHQGQQARLPH
ncbi:hypothetical protein BN1708_020043, partial [Verticillium longisporum]